MIHHSFPRRLASPNATLAAWVCLLMPCIFSAEITGLEHFNATTTGILAGQVRQIAVGRSFRIRSETGGAGKVEWIPSSGKMQFVPFQVPAGEWQDISADIPATAALGIFRLYLPAQSAPVELDHVELKGPGKPKRWDF
jgi:hypothetical protein